MNKKIKGNENILLNPRFVALYELIRSFRVEQKKALVLTKELFLKLPAESQVATKREIDKYINERSASI